MEPIQCIDEDLSCPGCKYNLRGLMRPRCPECGFGFEWSDLPAMRMPRPGAGAFVLRVARDLAITLLVMACFCLAVILSGATLIALYVSGWFMFVIPAIIAAPLVVAAIQSSVELVVLRPKLGPISQRWFRAWCEGTLIGYAIVGATMLATGYAVVLVEWSSPMERLVEHWPRMLLAVIEVSAVQCWVVRRRLRELGDSSIASSEGLAVSCVVAKCVSGLIWAVSPIALAPLAACRW